MNFVNYVGLPWLERGRDCTGIDCWGLLALFYRDVFGIDLPSFSDDYQTVADHAAVADLMNGNMSAWREVEAGTERFGDGVLMSIGGAPAHVGIVVKPGLVLHIERGTGSIIESYYGARLKRRVLGFFRHESLA